MKILILGLILFLGPHSISIVASGWRDRIAARIGERLFLRLYGLLSLVGFALIIHGYAAARQQPVLLYVPPTGMRHLALTLMLPVFPLLVAAYVPGRIKRAVKHPMLIAVALWGLAHLLANGMLADVVLFGSFLVWSVLDLISMSWRQPQSAPGVAPSKWNDLIAIVAGLAVYVAFVFRLHPWLIGVPVV